ncbi:MAG: hypothetical protein J6Z79_03340 [Clostridia bacterium]|nr:hypothetical protein [Clostridia bacterium]
MAHLIPKEKIEEITLLSTLEAREIPPSILEYPACCWWLRTPGKHTSYAATVCYFGCVLTRGHDVSMPNYGVRPALRLRAGEAEELKTGELVSCAGRQWVYAGNGLLLLTGEPLATMAFHKDSAAYEGWSDEEKYPRSDICAFLRNWFAKA